MRWNPKSTIAMRVTATTVISLFMSACGGGGGGSGTAVSPPPPPANSAPSSDAGPDQSVISGEFVTLNGSGSDPEGGNLTYSWIQSSGPSVMLLNSSSSQPRMIAPYTGNDSYDFELTVTDQGGLTATDSTSVSVTFGIIGCTVTSPPPELGLDPFHTKYCDANGISITSSSNVADSALENVAIETRQMTSMRPDVLVETILNGLRIVIRAENEVLTDIPEYADLYQRFPGTSDFDTLPGIGAVFGQTISSTSEENVLCRGRSRDPYEGFSVHIHEFFHSIENLGIESIDSSWNTRKENNFNSAISAGLWAGTYAATNVEEYVAQGAGSYYNAQFDSSAPLHNDIDTRAELLAYDLPLAEMLAEFLPAIDIWSCR